MATGTEGPDVLTNDQSLRSETIDALGGDDTINVSNAHPPGSPTDGSSVTVYGGSGFDTLNISAPNLFLFPSAAYLHDGYDPFSFYYLYATSLGFLGIEKLVVTGSGYFGQAPDQTYLPGSWSTGDTIDEIHVVSTRGLARITVSTGGGDDKIYLGAVGPGSTVNAGSGNDLVDLTGSNGVSSSALGGDGDDILIGSSGSNFLDGGPGADFLYLQHGGFDYARGGEGNDVLYFGPALTSADVAEGGPGLDQLALRGDYTIAFGAGQLIGIEQIGLVSAFDTRFGPLDDPYDYNLTMNDANVAAGVQMTVDAAPLRPGEILIFNGAAESDGSFRVFGGQGNDVIVGGQTGDVIVGGAGRDVLLGNPGGDVFRYNSAGDSTPAVQDLIRDFELGDLVDLSRIDADALTAGNQAFSFIGSAAFSRHAGELRVEDQRNPIWLVQGDTDGDGAADFELLLVIVDRHVPTSGDFIL